MNSTKTTRLTIFIKALFLLISVCSFSSGFGQSLNNNWEQDLSTSMKEFGECSNSTEANSDCFKYIGISLSTVYQVNDFYSKSTSRYMTPNEIAAFVSTDKQWEPLGHAYDKDALTKAQENANTKKAVVAVYEASGGQSHVVLVVPGSLTPSGSWGFDVPNTASFVLGDPGKSYVSKGLSYAFRKNMIKNIKLYTRKY